MSIEAWTPDALAQHIKEDALVLVDIKAPWCPRCGPQLKILNKLAPDYADSVTFGAVDLSDHEDVAAAYNVEGLPTLIVYKNGERVETLQGYQKASQITKALDAALNS